MRPWQSLLLVACASVPAAAQQVRPSIRLDSNVTGFGVAAAVDVAFDKTVALYSDTGFGATNKLYVVTSDGRGVRWGAPVRADAAPGLTTAPKRVQADSLAVHGNRVYVAWADERHSDGFGVTERDIYLNVSTNGGQSFAPTDTLLDKGTLAGFGVVHDWRMVVSPDPAGDHVYVLMSVDTDTISPEEIWLVASHDGGATFSSATQVSTVYRSGADVDEIGLAAEGNTVHVVWVDDRNGQDDLFYRRSTDGGSSFGAEVQLDETGPAGGNVHADLAVHAKGAIVSVAYLEKPVSVAPRLAFVRVSSDGGQTFAPVRDLQSLAGVPGPAAEVDTLVRDGRVLAMWEEDRGQGNAIYLRSSTDAGLTFGAESMLSPSGGTAASFGRGGPAVSTTWVSTGGTVVAQASVSVDGGATWSPAIDVSDTQGTAGRPVAAYNAMYDNLVLVWSSFDQGAMAVFAGGFRRQTLVPTGFTTTSSSARFAFSSYASPSPDTFGLVVLSLGKTYASFMIPDGRDLGLVFDPLSAIGLTSLDAFFTVLDPGGAGQTPAIPVKLQPGIRFYAVGIGLSSSFTAHLLSDVVEIAP